MKARRSWSSRANNSQSDFSDADTVGPGTDPLAGLLDAKFDDNGELVQGSVPAPTEEAEPDRPVEPGDLHSAVELLARRVDQVVARNDQPDGEDGTGPEDEVPDSELAKATSARNRTMEMLDQLEARLNSLSTQRQTPPGEGAPLSTGPIGETGDQHETMVHETTLDEGFGAVGEDHPPLELGLSEDQGWSPTSASDADADADLDPDSDAPSPFMSELSETLESDYADLAAQDHPLAGIDRDEDRSTLFTEPAAMEPGSPAASAPPPNSWDEPAPSAALSGWEDTERPQAGPQFEPRDEPMALAADTHVDERLEAAMAPLRDSLESRLDQIAELVGQSPDESSALNSVEHGYNHILERIAKIETTTQRAVPPDDLWTNIETIRNTMNAMPSAAGLEGRLNYLGERIEGLAESSIGRDLYDRFNHRLADLSTAIADLRASGSDDSGGIDERLVTIFVRIEELLSDERQVDLGPIEASLGEIARRLEDDLRNSHFGRIEHRLTEMGRSIEALEHTRDEEELAAIRQSLETLHDHVVDMAQTSAKADGDVAGLAEKLSVIEEKVDSLETLSQGDLAPIASRISMLERAVREDKPIPEDAFGALHEKLDFIREDLNTPIKSLSAVNVRLDALRDEMSAPGQALAEMGGKIDSLAQMHEKIDSLREELHPPESEFGDLRERLDGIVQKLADMEREGETRAGEAIDRIEQLQIGFGQTASPDDMESLTRVLGHLEDSAILEDVGELRSDIAHLRRELRSLPVGPDTQTDESIVAILRELSDRLDKIPTADVITFRDLEDQIGRIVRAIEDPDREHAETLKQVESRLIEIQQSVDAKTAADFTPLAADALGADPGVSVDAISAVFAEMTESMNGDLRMLKEAAAATEENTRRALEAVHLTLETILDRIGEAGPSPAPLPAFDVQPDAAMPAFKVEAVKPAASSAASSAVSSAASSMDSISEPVPPPPAIKASPALSDFPTGDREDAPERSRADEPPTAAEKSSKGSGVESLALTDIAIPAMIADEQETKEQAPDGAAFDADEPADTADVTNAAAHDASDAPTDDHQGVPETLGKELELSLDEAVLGIRANSQPDLDRIDLALEAGDSATKEPESKKPVGRLTPGQLLKRATGGKAESFAPPSEDASEPSDGLLDPNSGAPSSSTLLDAPGSGTFTLSGELVEPLDDRPEDQREPSFGPAPELDPTTTSAETAGAEMADELNRSDLGGETDFLVAARRAAQAAAQEVMDAEHRAGVGDATHARTNLLGVLNAKRRLILVSLLIIAIMVAGIQLIKKGMIPGIGDRPQAVSGLMEWLPKFGATELASNDGSMDAASDNAQPLLAADEGPSQEPVFTATLNQVPDAMALGTGNFEDATALTAPTPGPDDLIFNDTQIALTPKIGVAPELVAMPEAGSEESAGLNGEVDSIAVSDTKFPLPPEDIGTQRLRIEAANGNPVAMFDVATRYAEGRGVSQDIAAAAHWYALAADTGLPPAQYRLGSLYENGIGIDTDIRAAEAWYRRAAVAGNINAMHNLAVLYAEGSGGNPDLDAAASWFRRAAELGVRDSQFNLAVLHARGLGVPEDYVEAFKWFAIAARFGDLQAEERRDQLASALTDKQRETGLAAAKTFVPGQSNLDANVVKFPQDNWADAEPVETALSETDMVKRAQELLNSVGYDVGQPDGIFGPRTRRAIAAFQSETGIPATGRVDTNLLEVLSASAG